MTVRLWARSLDDARLISPSAELDPDNGPLGDHYAYVTEDPFLRCTAGCNRLLTPDEYSSDRHECWIEVSGITGLAEDISVETDGLLKSLAFLVVVVAVDLALLAGAIVGTVAAIRWLTR